MANEQVGLAEILEGQDAHKLNQAYFGFPEGPPGRLVAKRYLFRTIFNRGKGYAFTVDPDFTHVSTSQKYWDEVGRKFYTKYAAIEQLYQTNEKLVLQGKPLVGPLGREWPLELVRDKRTQDLVVPETKLVNYPVQGTGADVMAIARVSLYNRLKKKEWGKHVKLIATVHDSIVGDLPAELVQEYVNLNHQVFDDLPKNILKLFGYNWKVPLECEASAGPNMKECDEVKRTDL